MPRTLSGRKQKGRTFEKEVSALFKAHGWERACPTPGSGALRPWGAGDIPAWPGDVAFVGRWLVEAKRDERMAAPSRGWQGEAFVRATIRNHRKLAFRMNSTVGGKKWLPVVVGRASFADPRWFIPHASFVQWAGKDTWSDGWPYAPEEEWVELDTTTFFTYALDVSPP